jgi:hypothetical protein
VFQRQPHISAPKADKSANNLTQEEKRAEQESGNFEMMNDSICVLKENCAGSNEILISARVNSR